MAASPPARGRGHNLAQQRRTQGVRIKLVLLAVCIETVATFRPGPTRGAAPVSGTASTMTCGRCAPGFAALDSERSRLHCAGVRPICGARRRAGITALSSEPSAGSDTREGPGDSLGDSGWGWDEPIQLAGGGVPDSSTVTLQRLSAALQEEGASIEAREDARSGGRKRRLFRPRLAAPAIPQYGAVSVVEPTRQHTATIIWLHDAPPGSASSPRRWQRRLQRLNLGWCRIVIPSGFKVERQRTLLEKLVRRRDPRHWYEEGSDRGLSASLQYVQTLVAREVQNGVAPDRIMIAGVGQGADVAVLTGLLLNARLGGVLPLAAHLPETIALVPSPESAATPFLCSAGG